MQHDNGLEQRSFHIAAIVVTVLAIYAVRLFYLQLVDTRFAGMEAGILTRTVYPARGLVYDRKSRLLVENEPAFDLVVTTREMKGLDTLDLCAALGITREVFEQRMDEIRDRRRNPGFSSYTQQTFSTQLSVSEAALLRERLRNYNGFDIRSRTIRQYKYSIAPHILGNVREVSPREMEADDYYRRGDYTGDLGVEKSYEKLLRGEKGSEKMLRDAHGRIQGRYENGKYDVPPVPGHNLTLSIDAELQAYAESLMVNKVGAVVAIQPKTGEILCMVSAPTFDPQWLSGRQRGKYYSQLVNTEFKPLYDRAVSASYPPGSTFKPTQGLIALQEGAITPTGFTVPCSRGYHVGGFRMGCHAHASPLPLIPAIATSCNAYFAGAFRTTIDNRRKHKTIQEAFDAWKDYMVSMGYGYKLGVDIPNETRGFIPNSAYYDKAFKTQAWKSLNIVSISIGQGEVLATPLQIANLAATIANRGHYYTPHVLHAVEGGEVPKEFTEQHRTAIDRKYYDYIVEGMRGAVVGTYAGGTCRGANLDALDIAVCGKTGTAQNPHGRDHSVFMGFAPMDDPEIAICVYVENAGFGATFGVPIGSLVMEKYLTGEISQPRKWVEDRMLTTSTMAFMQN